MRTLRRPERISHIVQGLAQQQASPVLKGEGEKCIWHGPGLQLNGLLQLHLLFKLSWRRAESVIYSSAAAAGWIRVANQSV